MITILGTTIFVTQCQRVKKKINTHSLEAEAGAQQVDWLIRTHEILGLIPSPTHNHVVVHVYTSSKQKMQAQGHPQLHRVAGAILDYM